MSWIPDPSSRVALDGHSFGWHFLPTILLYYVTAVLVCLPRTLPVRLALWPVTLYSAFQTSVTLDLAKGLPNEDHFAYLNQGLLLSMCVLSMHVTIWAFSTKPYKRIQPSGNLFVDAFDLATNLRGIGWPWSAGIRILQDSRDTASYSSFLLSTLSYFLQHFVLFDIFLCSVQLFLGSSGASIYSASLPPVLRYLRSSAISFFSGLTIYHIICAFHYLASFISLALLPNGPNNNPTAWPPLFRSPWFTTSLNEFWSGRWHQLFRNIFIHGGLPFFLLFGRLGAVFGAFLTSGIIHWIGLWGMGRGTDFWRVAGFFLMMGVGTILEVAFRRITGKRVGGVLGWMWSIVWVLGWANMLVDAWLTRGMAASVFMPEQWRPSRVLLRVVGMI